MQYLFYGPNGRSAARVHELQVPVAAVRLAGKPLGARLHKAHLVEARDGEGTGER